MIAYNYCISAIEKDSTPIYVKKQMREFIDLCDGKSEKYYVSPEKVETLENALKLLIMPKGLKAGQTLYECSTNYQWLFYTATLCTVYRENPDKRRYETGLLEICRKNFTVRTLLW